MRAYVNLRENQLNVPYVVRRLNAWREQLRMPLSKKIARGHSYIMSPFMEDLFAQFLEKMLGDRVDFILVDTAINLNGKTVRPDIILIKNHTIIGFFDCKVSLWNRGGVAEMATTYMGYLHEIRKCGGKVKVTTILSDEPWPTDDVIDDKELQNEYLVADSACWDVVVAHVWGKSNGIKVMNQINIWNDDSSHAETRIWHMMEHIDKKEAGKKKKRKIYNQNVLVEIRERVLSTNI